MRTFAARQRDIEQSRYLAEGDGAQFDPRTAEGAKGLLSTRGGKKAAQIAISEMWKAAKTRAGWGVLADEASAPIRILLALTTLGIAEQIEGEDAPTYRLTPNGAVMAAKLKG